MIVELEGCVIVVGVARSEERDDCGMTERICPVGRRNSSESAFIHNHVMAKRKNMSRQHGSSTNASRRTSILTFTPKEKAQGEKIRARQPTWFGNSCMQREYSVYTLLHTIISLRKVRIRQDHSVPELNVER
jgi:hypothetical protein